MARGPSPTAALKFEREVNELLREVGRVIVELAYNRLEGEQPEQLPPTVELEAGSYRRLNAKTPNREVASLFGKLTLWRHGYRYAERDVAEPTIFPLEVQLGLVEGATPALASEAARMMAETGATQQTVLAHYPPLKRWSVRLARHAEPAAALTVAAWRDILIQSLTCRRVGELWRSAKGATT